jgi:hypothetical protein
VALAMHNRKNCCKNFLKIKDELANYWLDINLEVH